MRISAQNIVQWKTPTATFCLSLEDVNAVSFKPSKQNPQRFFFKEMLERNCNFFHFCLLSQSYSPDDNSILQTYSQINIV